MTELVHKKPLDGGLIFRPYVLDNGALFYSWHSNLKQSAEFGNHKH